MSTSSTCIPQAQPTWFERLEKPLTGLFLTFSLAVVGLAQTPARSSEVTLAAKASPNTNLLVSQQSAASPLEDGMYLYGQSPEPEQLGAGYMVFEATDGQVVGAFYMPRSSFDCFYGEIEADQLALTVIDSYEQTLHPYAVALETPDPVAMAGSDTIAPMNLEGFHRIDTISDNDQRILSTCKADPNVQ